jgi:transcription elongation factor GreA
MSTNNCLDIKNLEERLTCLSEKYNELTDEREGTSSDDSGNIHYISTQREFILKQIQATRKRIEVKGRTRSKKMPSDTVKLGSRVKLQNHKSSLEVEIVDEQEANPIEGLISLLSPIGSAIMGRARGEEVVVNLPSGVIPYIIQRIN